MRTAPAFRLGLLAASLSLLPGCERDAPADADAPNGGVAVAGAEWKERGALYEVFVRDFSETGDFQGLIDGLDRIEASGANILWLMPIHPVGELNRKGTLGSSYSVVDYRAVNPEYGDTADFRRLVSAVHERGMKLIIDWVPNHTAWDSPWMTEHPDWYTKNAEGEVTEPLNDDGSSTTWTDVADLDYSNVEMRRAMIDAMRFWLEEFDIDGYRVDVAGMVPGDFWREALPELRTAGGDEILLLAEWGTMEMYELGFDLTYGWDGYSRLKEVWRGEQPASAFVAHALQEADSLPDGGRRMRFTTNHDETAWDEPAVTLFGGAAGARAAYTAMALLPGVPLLYNGQEIESDQQLGLFERMPVEWTTPGADSARAHYRRVLDLARTAPAFAGNDLEAVTTSAADDVIAYRRGNALVLVNVSTEPSRFTVSDAAVAGARDLLGGAAQQGDTMSLGGHGAVVLELAD